MKKEIEDNDIWDLMNNKLGIENREKLKQAESDIVIVRIAELLKTDYFIPTVEYYKSIHKYLFGDIYYFAGIFRPMQIYREENILARMSVNYSKPEGIESNLQSIFERIRNTNFNELNTDEKIDYISDVIRDIWQVHAFMEGNTRTTLVFMRALLKSYNITFSSSVFTKRSNFKYMRDALVAASFEAGDLGIKKNKTYINRVISDIIIDDLEKKRGM